MSEERRSHAYAAMARLTADVKVPAVLILIDPGQLESHVQISDPSTEELRDLKITGQKALNALSLYLEQIDVLIEADQGAQTAQS